MMFKIIALLAAVSPTSTIHAYSLHDRRDVTLTVLTRTELLLGAMIAPPPTASRVNLDSSERLKSIPRVGYSLYNTELEQVERCVELALDAGVRHFDVATQYGSNAIVGQVLRKFIKQTDDGKSRKQHRDELFVHHKVSNMEQSTSKRAVKKRVKNEMSKLQLRYLDLCSIHSPLTDKERRLSTYEALLELQEEGIVKSVGVCNYGINPLNEILDVSMPAPSVIQLILSPFSQRKEVVAWASQQNSVMSCTAWSKLSSSTGPVEGWAILADIASHHRVSTTSVLVKWALQQDYLCVPRSGSKYDVEQLAIQENSFQGVKDFSLSKKELEILNSLDEKIPAGKLGIRDGWEETDILNDRWDPTRLRLYS